MRKGMSDIVVYVAVLLLIAYLIWFLLTHSAYVTITDLMAVFGGMIAVFTLLFGETSRRTKNLERKIDKIAEQLNYLKGRLNERKRKRD